MGGQQLVQKALGSQCCKLEAAVASSRHHASSLLALAAGCANSCSLSKQTGSMRTAQLQMTATTTGSALITLALELLLRLLLGLWPRLFTR